MGPGQGPHVLWGFKSRENWHGTTGRHSEHVEPSRRMQTTYMVKTMSDKFRMPLS